MLPTSTPPGFWPARPTRRWPTCSCSSGSSGRSTPSLSPPHRALKFLATDFAGGTFAEHTCLEMALGEGFVLMAIYALIDTLPESEVRNLLVGLSRQEEGHVSFGEDQTVRALGQDPSQGRQLLGLSLVSLVVVRRLAGWTRRRYGAHPVLSQMPGFLRATAAAAELRLGRMGVVRRPLAA